MRAICKKIIKYSRNFIAKAGIVNIQPIDIVKMSVKMDEDKIEAIRYFMVQVISEHAAREFADQKSQMVLPSRSPHECYLQWKL